MTKHPHYSRAPITEATIDLAVDSADVADISRLAEFNTSVKANYPDVQPIYESEFRFQVGGQPLAENTQQHIGFRLTSKDRKQVILARVGGFALSLLPPYDNWEPFRDQARVLWNEYKSVMDPKAVTRIAVRYINRLDIPSASIELGEFLRTVPELSPDMPQTLLEYFMRLVVPVEDVVARAIINQALVLPPPQPDTTSIVLDIDLFRDTDIPQDEDSIWSLFERLRDHKNDIFNACLTAKTKELIQ